MIGKIISNYKITDFVEEGGMGTIYKGSHLKLERPVAIKILHQNLTANPQFKERFLNEAKILAKLSHPNIINIYDFIEQDGQFFIIAEFIEGKPMDKMISTSMIASTTQALQFFKQILSGIGYAHTNRVVHRDIKPSNVMIQPDNIAKILDFGIAKLNDSSKSLTKTGTKMGSLYYMSPEQVLGKNLDSRTDIYSLGIVLFEMLTHRLPYNTQTESDYELMNSVLTQEMPDIDSFISGLDPNTGSVIRKACAKDPDERFSTCEEFSSALNNANFTFTTTSSDYAKTQFIENHNLQNTNQRTIFQEPGQSPVINTDKQNQKSKNSGFLILSGALLVIIIIITIFLVTMNNDSELTATTNTTTTSTQSSNNTNSSGTGNSNTGSNTYNNSGNSSDKSSTNYSSSPAVETAKGFISDLGSQNFRSAFEKQKNSGWGTYDNFSSIKSFGGITSTSINDISLNYENPDAASVYIDYYSYDPYNKDGRYKQNFIMKKYPDGWKIVKIENIKIEQWKK